jgi:hypothetical protein
MRKLHFERMSKINTCCLPQVNTSAKNFKRRLIASAILLCFIAVFMLSEAFILTNSEHTHDTSGPGGGCTVCFQLQSVQSLLKQLAIAAGGTIIAACRSVTPVLPFRPVVCRAGLFTPVGLAVRANK